MATKTDWLATMTELSRSFGERTAQHDREDAFVAENYDKLKQVRAFAAGVPTELGGDGASHAELCAMVRTLARGCSSTALAFSMHTHLVATQARLWRSGNTAPEKLLRRVAAENLVLVSTGGADWLAGSGRLEKVEGGYKLYGRKIFCSGVPGGDLLMTMGIYEDPQDGPVVFHFPLSTRAEGVKVLDTWRTMGMRGTGSHDVEIDGAFLPDAVMGGVRRPAGKWHPSMHTVTLVALPLIYAAYLGTAESARDLALQMARAKRDNPLTAVLAGEMESFIVTAQIAHASMVELVATATPGPATTSATLCRRTIVTNAVIRAVEKAMELAGGAGFFRAAPLERMFRDVQGAKYHPVAEKSQQLLTGRHTLGLDLD